MTSLDTISRSFPSTASWPELAIAPTLATFIVGGVGNDLLQHKWLRTDTLEKSPKTEMMDYETKGRGLQRSPPGGFNQTRAQDGGEGFDIAKFWDTLDDDRFSADGDTAAMYCPDSRTPLRRGRLRQGRLQPRVDGGDDTVDEDAHDFILNLVLGAVGGLSEK